MLYLGVQLVRIIFSKKNLVRIINLFGCSIDENKNWKESAGHLVQYNAHKYLISVSLSLSLSLTLRFFIRGR